MKQLEARQLNNFFNSFVREQRDKQKSNYDASLIVELTGPEYVGGATRDTNGDNLTVQLVTKSYTCEKTIFIASHRSDLVSVFFKADAQERGEKHRGVVVVFKNQKGQRDYFTVPKYHYTSDKERDVNEKVQHRLGFGSTWDLERSEHKETLQALIDSISDSLCSYATIKTEDRDAMQSLGVKIEDVMEYTHSLQFTPKFIRQSKNSVLVGWMSFGTYASHPMTLKISKALKGINLVRLADFGAEASGYYDHHNKHTCKPEHVPALKAFAKSFKKLSRKAV